MSAEKDLIARQIDTIVGLHLRALMDSGVSPEDLGASAARFRTEVHQVFMQPEETMQVPNLKDAIKDALVELGVAPGRQTVGKVRKRITVVIGNGVRTTITIDHAIMVNLVSFKGSTRAANNLIRSIAVSAPETVRNRSAWIEERIQQVLTFNQSPAVLGDQASDRPQKTH
jgi:hypothetical protein